MELKPLKKGEVAVTVTYRITDELINEKIPFLRANSSLKAYEGIPAITYQRDGFGMLNLLFMIYSNNIHYLNLVVFLN